MKDFQYITREYIPSVDLQTLGNTYNTLEEGHKEAMKTASDLKVSIASLPMNEAEDSWKQQKIAEIQDTIDANSIYGNSYGALDDLVVQFGNITSDQGTIGRLRAQQDYQTFKDNIDKRTDLPDNYKEYYKKMNPYYYQDTIDENTGKVIGSSKWTPVETPETVVPLDEIIANGIRIAAAQTGNATGTMWIDVNGKPTLDPSKSYDGEVYMTTTSGYQILSKDKIRAGIQAFIESTPGAKASLAQDYKIAKYEYLTKGNTDVLDKNGVPLSEQQYLEKRIDPALQAASYYNTHSSVTYGEGLKTYKAGMAAAKNAGTSAIIDNELDNLRLTSRNTPVTVDYDYASNLKSDQQNSYNNLINSYKRITGKDLTDSMKNASSEDWRKLINNIKMDSNNAEDIVNMRRSLRKLEEANYNYNQIISKISSKDKADELDFVTRMSNGAEFNPNNPYDKRILNTINDNILGTEGETLMITTNDDDVYNNILNTINGDNITGYKSLGIEIGTNSNGTKYFKINRDRYENLILLSKAYNDALNKQSFWGSLTNSTNVSLLDSNGNTIVSPITVNKDKPAITGGTYKAPVTSRYRPEVYFRDLGRMFDEANSNVKEELASISPSSISISNENLPGKTFSHNKLYNIYTRGDIKDSQFTKHESVLDDELRSKLIGTNFTQVDIFDTTTKDGSGFLYRLPESSDRQEIGKQIINAIGTKRFDINAAYNPVYGAGSNITIYTKEDKDGNPIGNPKTYFIPGLITEQAAYEFENDPSTIASKNIAIGNEVRKTINLSTKYDTPTLGAQQIICNGEDNFIYKINGQEIPINRNEAVNINRYMEEYLAIKDYYLSGMYDISNPNVLNSLDESIKLIANKIAISSGQEKNENGIYLSLSNDLNK